MDPATQMATDGLQAFTDAAPRQGIEYFKAWYASDPARQIRTADQVLADCLPLPSVAL